MQDRKPLETHRWEHPANPRQAPTVWSVGASSSAVPPSVGASPRCPATVAIKRMVGFPGLDFLETNPKKSGGGGKVCWMEGVEGFCGEFRVLDDDDDDDDVFFFEK